MQQARLSIPPAPEHVRLVRLVVAAAARRAGLTDEQLDDVRLAVGEAVSRAVSRQKASQSESEVHIAIIDSAESFSVGVTDDAPAQVSDLDDGVALALISALAPVVEQVDRTLILRWEQPTA